MLIILEGPDGAGKSTLAREIADLIGQHAEVTIRHAGPPSNHPLNEYEMPLVNYRPGVRHVICDRWHVGEAVYPHVLDRPTRWDTAVGQHINLFMQSRGACVVLLNPPVDELETRLSIRGDNLVSVDMLGDIAHRFDALPVTYFNFRYAYNSGTHRVPTPRGIVRLARRMHLAASALTSFETYVGPPRPKTLILGDERLPNIIGRRPYLPAFAPYRATSGHYLLSYLHAGRSIGLANACDVDDPHQLWLRLGSPSVVTLGRNASRRCDELKIPHGSVPHPQFIRRFHYRSGDKYADVILRAARTGEDMLSWRP